MTDRETGRQAKALKKKNWTHVASCLSTCRKTFEGQQLSDLRNYIAPYLLFSFYIYFWLNHRCWNRIQVNRQTLVKWKRSIFCSFGQSLVKVLFASINIHSKIIKKEKTIITLHPFFFFVCCEFGRMAGRVSYQEIATRNSSTCYCFLPNSYN